MSEGTRESVDAGCRRLTASWVRERAQARREEAEADAGGDDEEGGGDGGGPAEVELCDFFESFTTAGGDAQLPPGVYTARVH